MGKEKESKVDIVKKKGVEYKDKAVEKLEQADEYVKENPKKSAGIAFGIGAALGAIGAFLLRKKKKND
tara:strand:- start:2718 stop:2921 length:204 start_codon:yes stop_codon:yes gene_type:complete